MTEHIVTGHRNGSVFPYVVATGPDKAWTVVNELLRSAFRDSPYDHDSVSFYVADRPVLGRQYPDRWLRIGFHEGFGGALFYDGSRLEGEDWSWAALAAQPLPHPPTIYFDTQGGVIFPPRTVMPMEQLRAVVLEWVETGEQPTSVEWLTLNDLVWRLDKDGNVVVRRTGLSA